MRMRGGLDIFIRYGCVYGAPPRIFNPGHAFRHAPRATSGGVPFDENG